MESDLASQHDDFPLRNQSVTKSDLEIRPSLYDDSRSSEMNLYEDHLEDDTRWMSGFTGSIELQVPLSTLHEAGKEDSDSEFIEEEKGKVTGPFESVMSENFGELKLEESKNMPSNISIDSSIRNTEGFLKSISQVIDGVEVQQKVRMDRGMIEKQHTVTMIADTIKKKGYIYKLSPSKVIGWQKRYFVLFDWTLKYYKNESEFVKKKPPKGIIDFSRLDVCIDKEKNQQLNLHIEGCNRIFQLKVSDKT